MKNRFRVTSGLALAGLALGGLALGGLAMTGRAQEQPATEHLSPKEKIGSVVSLDVYTHKDILDMVVATETDIGPTLTHRRSMDGGRTWSPETKVEMSGTTISNAMRGLDPQIAAQDDHIFIVWTTPGEGQHGVGPFGTALSDDGGKTWRRGTNPADDDSKKGHAFIESIVDQSGVLHVVWLETRATRGLFAATSKDFGKTWAKTITVDSLTCECCWNKMLSLRPGETHLLYRDKDPRDMAIAMTSDSGASWTRLATVGDFNWPINACPFTGGGLAVTGSGPTEKLHSTVFSGAKDHRGVSYLVSKDNGKTWSEPVALGEGRGQHSDLASLGRNLVTVYDVTDPDDGLVIGVRRSGDEGATWSEFTRLSPKGVKADFPRVLSVQGRFVAFWTEKDANGMVSWRQMDLTAREPKPAAP
ncbi:MAG: sialidase family protein [Vicinamibacteria bacterium]